METCAICEHPQDDHNFDGCWFQWSATGDKCPCAGFLRPARTHRGCDGCSAMWDDGWVDLIVPDSVWSVISPDSPDGESGGYLCARCLTARLVEHGLTDVPVRAYGKPFWTGAA